MSKNSRKRKFYPEFYSDEEYAEKTKAAQKANENNEEEKKDEDKLEKINENEKNSIEIIEIKEEAEKITETKEIKDEVKEERKVKIEKIQLSADELMAKKFNALKPTQVFASNPELMKRIDNIKDDFIKQQSKLNTRSTQNPMNLIEFQKEYVTKDTVPEKTISKTVSAENIPENRYSDEIANDTNEMKESGTKTMNHDKSEKESSELDIISGEDLLKIHNAENMESSAEELTDKVTEEVFSQENLPLFTEDNFSEKALPVYIKENFKESTVPMFEKNSEKKEERKEMEEGDIKFEPIQTIPTFEEPAKSASERINNVPIHNGFKPYNRENAVIYARRWALDRNPEYYNFEEVGGDCTNYASQVILAGGCEMNYTPTFGWYYSGANDKSPSWTGAEYFFNFLISEHSKGAVGKEADISEVEPGDIVQLSFNGKTFQHSPVIVKIKKDENGNIHHSGIFVCAHTFDCENRPLDTYNWRKIRFIKILGTK